MDKKTDLSITVNILIKKEDDLFVAHCLELDIVATSKTAAGAQKDIVSLISAQVDYAFSNDNLDQLFHSAPSEVWKEFLSCKMQAEKRYALKSAYDTTLPPWLIAKTCQYDSAVNA